MHEGCDHTRMKASFITPQGGLLFYLSSSLLQVKDMEEGVRNAVGTRLLQLTLRELFSWRFMQTDPNWCAAASPRLA